MNLTPAKLCEPLGMVSPGYWMVDPAGTEQSFAGLNLTARDYATLGELYRDGGLWQGERIVPADWVRDSVTAAAPHLEAGRPLDPASSTTIVKLSANRRYGTSTEESTNREMETVAFLRAIAQHNH